MTEEAGLLANPYFWTTSAFFIFVALLWKLGVFKMMTRALDQESEKISAQLSEAKRLREEAAETLKQYRARAAQAAAEASRLLSDAKRDAEQIRAQAEQELQDAMARREAQAKARIAQAEAEAIAELKALTVDLAAGASAALIREHLSAQQAGQLVDQAIAALPRQMSDKAA